MRRETIERAFGDLAARFGDYDWVLHDVPGTGGRDGQWHWVGAGDEDIVICVFRGDRLDEPFHRQDFFYFNFAYEGYFKAIGQQEGHVFEVCEGDVVAGQPFTGYALKVVPPNRCTIVGILVRREVFFRMLLPILAESPQVVHFFLNPEQDRFSNELMHIRPGEDSPFRTLAELMVVEYSAGAPGSQGVLRALTLAFAQCVCNCFQAQRCDDAYDSLADRLRAYVATHAAHGTLAAMAQAFSYHPNYLSALIKEETGKTFKQLQLEYRMRQARLFLETAPLSVEEVATAVGYATATSFYKAYRAYFGCSPRESVR